MSSELSRLGSYRVGDTERARTVDLLKEAHVAGYLTLAEIDERLSAALAAKTRADLERLVADLPPEWRSGQEPRPAPPPRRLAVAPVLRVLPVLLVVALVILAVSRGFYYFPWPLLWVFFFVFRGGRHHDHYHHRGGGWQGRDSNRVTWI